MLPILLVLASAATGTATAATLAADLATHQTVLTVHAEGAQVYQCKPGTGGVLAWAFREPIAALIADGPTIGRHYAGPHWALDDGSLVEGRMVATAPAATGADVPLLKLAVIENNGRGALAPVTLVYRMNTHGGSLAGTCATAGVLQAVAYSADYIFAK